MSVDASQGGRPRVPAWCWLALLAVLVFNVWWRAHTFGPTLRDRFGLDLWPVSGLEAEPLDCDESAYAYIGRRVCRGDVLYRDLTENKPPGGYWLYALAVALGGADELTIRAMPVPIVLAMIALVWWIAGRLSGPGAAVVAAAISAIVSADPYLFGNGANLEHAINLASLASLALMIRALGEGHDPPPPAVARGAIVLSGVFLGAACLVKQVVITHFVLYVFVLGLRRRTARAFFRDVVALSLGFASVWVLALGVLVAQGAGRSAFEDIVRYGGALATDTPPDPHAPPFLVRWITGNADPRGGLPWPFGRTDYLVWWGTGSWPLWLTAVPALAWLGLGPSSAPRRLVAAWTLSAWLQVALPRLFWQHYYLLPLPGLALCVALFLSDAVARARSVRGPLRSLWVLVVLGVATALAWTTVIQVRDYLLVPPHLLTVRFKGGGQWVRLRQLGRALAYRTSDWDAPGLYVWGWQSPLYFYSGLDSPSPHFFADPLLKAFAGKGHPLIEPRTDRIVADLRARPPALIFTGDPPFPELREFLRERYRPSMLVPEGPYLWVERDRFEAFERGPQARVPAIRR